MRNPKHFEGWTGVLNTGMVVVSALYFAVGFYGYIKYGDEIRGSITLNLPADELLAQSVKLMVNYLTFITIMNIVKQFYFEYLDGFGHLRKLRSSILRSNGNYLAHFGLQVQYEPEPIDSGVRLPHHVGRIHL